MARLTRTPTEAERAGRPWNVTILRAINPDGSILWPEHNDLTQYQDIAESGGRALFSAIWMQDPSGLAGDVFRPEWWQEYVHPGFIERQPSSTKPGTWISVTAEEMLREGLIQAILPDIRSLVSLQACDLAIKQTEVADFYARCNGYVSKEGRVFFEHFRQDKLTDLEMVADMAEAGHHYKAKAIGVESNGFQSLIFKQASRGHNLPFVELDPAGRDKVIRARPLAAAMENGKVFFRYGMPMSTPIRYQFISFPAVPHDDAVDAAAYLYELALKYGPGKFSALSQLTEELRSSGRRLSTETPGWMR